MTKALANPYLVRPFYNGAIVIGQMVPDPTPDAPSRLRNNQLHLTVDQAATLAARLLHAVAEHPDIRAKDDT